jgi:hypothetical protein
MERALLMALETFPTLACTELADSLLPGLGRVSSLSARRPGRRRVRYLGRDVRVAPQ